jgi:hypothetical protein
MKNLLTMIATIILALLAFAIGIWRAGQDDSVNAGLFAIVGVGILFVGVTSVMDRRP